MLRVFGAGLVLFAFAGFIGFDSWSKLAWPRVHATVLSVEPKCEMKSEQNNLLTRTTSTASIDCDLVETFKILHPDKEWTLRRTYLTHLKVGGAHPVATSMVVYSEPAPKPAQDLVVIQDPKDPLRVLGGNASASGFGTAVLLAIIGGLLVIVRFVLRAVRRRSATPPPGSSSDPGGPISGGPSAARDVFAARAVTANSAGRVFGRR